MDTEIRTRNYPKLSRPQRKLNFHPNTERSPKQWRGKPTLEDVDRLFDELDSSDDFESIMPLSPQTTSGAKENHEKMAEKKKKALPAQQECPSPGTIQQCPAEKRRIRRRGEFQLEAKQLVTTEQNLVPLETGSPFVGHGPIITSSPLEATYVDEMVQAVSPFLFICDEEEGVPEEEPKTASSSVEGPQSQGPNQSSGEDVSEASPIVFVLPKPKMQRVIGDVNIRQESAEQPVLALRPVPESPSTSGSGQPAVAAVKSPRVHKERSSSFLQKLSEAGLSKTPRKPLYLVKEPSLPEEPSQEPEEDFEILEDEPPGWFCIPRKKSATSTSKHKAAPPTATHNNNDCKLSSPGDRGLKQDPLEKVETREPGPEEGCPSTEKNQKKKKKEKASVPSLASPKKSATSKKTKIAMETAVRDPSPASDPVDCAEHQKQRKNTKTRPQERKSATEEMRPCPSMPQGLPPHHTSTSQVVQLIVARTMANRKQRTSSVTKRPKSTTEVHHGEEEEEEEEEEEKMKAGKSVKMKARKSVKRRLREDLPSSEAVDGSPPRETQEEQSPQPGPSNTTQARVRRERKPPGEWWLSQPSFIIEEPVGPSAAKSPKKDPGRPQAAAAAAEPEPEPEPEPFLERKTPQDGGPTATNKHTPSSTRRKGKGRARKATNGRRATGTTGKGGRVAGLIEEEIQSLQQEVQPVPDPVLDPGALGSEESSSRLERLAPAKRSFNRTYRFTSNGDRTSGAAPESWAPGAKKGRTRKPPGDWWIGPDRLHHPDTNSPSLPPARPPSPPPTPPPPPPPPPSPPPSKKREARKGGKRQANRRKSIAAATETDRATATTAAGSALFKMFPPPRTTKSSLAVFQDIFSRTTEASPPDAAQKELVGGRKRGRRMQAPDPYAGSDDDDDDDVEDHHHHNSSSSRAPQIVVAPAEHSSRFSWPSAIGPPQHNKRLSDTMTKGLISGPSSMLNLEQHEESGDTLLPVSSRIQHYNLLPMGLHSPPLVAMVLQDEDQANLKEWLALLWPAPVQVETGRAGPENFQWFCHRGRALGLQVDTWSNFICTGKIILGSDMKKPLWVDHLATTIFNVSTSCVALTLDTIESHYSAGQSFVVSCGHAYSIKNLSVEPAILFFSWVQAESPE